MRDSGIKIRLKRNPKEKKREIDKKGRLLEQTWNFDFYRSAKVKQRGNKRGLGERGDGFEKLKHVHE